MQGNEAAEEKLLKFYIAKYSGFLIKNNIPKADIPAVFGRAFFKLIGRLKDHTKTEVDSVRNYFFTILKNCAADYHKKKKRDDEKSLEIDKNPNRPSLELNPDSEQVELEKKLLFEDRMDLVEKAIKKLGKKCQDVLIAYYFQGLKPKKIAEQLGYKSGAVVSQTRLVCFKKLLEEIRKIK